MKTNHDYTSLRKSVRMAENMAALHLASDSRDYLMWCPDTEFDRAVALLDMRGLVDLVHALQDAMAVEQQTFESLSQQLEGAEDPLLQQRLSAALCTSQTRLARLCSRNMRCFTQQALKSRPRSGEPSTSVVDSRSSSPRDSGFAVSSSGSDFESDIRGPSATSSPPNASYGGPSFRNSLAFFQKAASFVTNNSKNFSKGSHSSRTPKRTYKKSNGRSDRQISRSEDAITIDSKHIDKRYYVDNVDIELNRIEDPETYEQVLFINGRPQYQQESSPRRAHSYDAYLESRQSPKDHRLSRDSRVTTESLLSTPVSLASTTIHITSDYCPAPRRSQSSPNNSDRHSSGSRTRVQIVSDAPVDTEPPSRPVRLKDSLHSKSLSDVTTCVTLPRRKPVLNFGSVSECVSDRVNCCDAQIGSVTGFSGQRACSSRGSDIKRSQSFKEGLDYSNDVFSASGKGTTLCRTQSCCDGLAGEVSKNQGSKLSRAPSVDEILESVKYLRAKRSKMVKSSPDLLQQTSQDKCQSSRLHKNSSKKSSSKSSTTSLVGIRFNGSVGSTSSALSTSGDKRERSHRNPDYAFPNHYYENVTSDDKSSRYENLPVKKSEVIYDRPKSTKKVEKESDVSADFYENVNYDPPVYENVSGEKEPTYMNVTGKSPKRKPETVDQASETTNIYATVDQEPSTQKLRVTKKNRQGKVVVITGDLTSQNPDDSQTYDVPKAATHIYDTPPKQPRQIRPQSTSKIKKYEDNENNYDTPKNNRSVLPQSTQILLKVKEDRIQKIDHIFANCEHDSLDAESGTEKSVPEIPPPDYGSEEEESSVGAPRGKSVASSSDYIDEGLGESDTRSYYVDDQGLEVILEEPEDEYCSSHSSEEDLRRRLGLQVRHKGESRSLDGSEGIGSAEGDSHSSGSDIGVEDDCGSSGVHSEDTSSPGPPHHHLERPSKDEAGTTLHTGKDLLSPLKEITSVSKDHTIRGEDEQTPQQDRCIEVYPETLRQRQRNMAPSPSKVDIKNWESATGGSDDDSKGGKKFLPSVKALRHQFENGRPSSRETSPPLCTHVSTMEATNKQGRTSSSSSTSSLTMSSLETSSGFGSLNSSQATVETSSTAASKVTTNDDIVEPIFRQFQPINDELKDLMSQPPSTAGWNPQILLKKLYYLPEVPKMQHHGTSYTNIEGYLEKLPSGRKKATFWNAWKRRYFAAKEGILYYYQSKETEKPNMKLPLMGGKVEIMDTNTISIDDGDKDVGSGSMLGIDDGKGHYVVVRCISRQEAERWKKALETHTVEDFSSQFVQPWPRPTNPTLLRDTIVIDIGSCSVRAGVLASQATLPQLFFPSVVTTNRESHNQIWGLEALTPEARTGACVAFPVRPSHKISKFSVDLNAVSGLLQKTFNDLKVDPKNYNIQMSVPRVLNPHTQAELLKILFDKFGVKAVNLTHQAILALYSYNATSGIVVDIGERIDVVPVTDGYIVDGGVSRVPYGGYRIMDHLRQFLFQRNLSLINEVDSYIIRQILETVCYCALHYNAEKQRCTMNPENFEKSADLTNFFPKAPQFEAFHNITLDFGRFQASEGLFNPDAWGLDHPGLHKLVHKAIQECSLDIRKEMSRSVFLAGGVSLLPGLNERLTVELDNLTPPAVRPKVHASPYRYHSAYIGACVLAESPAFIQSRITKEEWHKQGNSALRKWAL